MTVCALLLLSSVARCPNFRLETKHDLREEDHPFASVVGGSKLGRRGAGCSCEIYASARRHVGQDRHAGRDLLGLAGVGGITKAYVTSDNGSKLAFIAVPETTASNACEKTAVTLQRNGGNWSVRSMCFGELQRALYFPAAPVETAIAALPSHPQPITGAR